MAAMIPIKTIATISSIREKPGLYLLPMSVAQTCSLSVSPEIVAAREGFFNHGWTRINTDDDRTSLIRVHPCSSVVGSYWLRLRRAALYGRFLTCHCCLRATFCLPGGFSCGS